MPYSCKSSCGSSELCFCEVYVLFVHISFVFTKGLISWFHFVMQIFTSPSVSRHYFHQMKLCMKDHINVLPPDIAIDLPGCACLLGNLLEVAGLAFAQPESFTMVKTKKSFGRVY